MDFGWDRAVIIMPDSASDARNVLAPSFFRFLIKSRFRPGGEPIQAHIGWQNMPGPAVQPVAGALNVGVEDAFTHSSRV